MLGVREVDLHCGMWLVDRALCCFVLSGEWKWVLCRWCPVTARALRDGTAGHLKGRDFLSFWDRVSQCRAGWPRVCGSPPRCWDYRHLLHPARTGTSESAFLVTGVWGGVGRLEEQCKRDQSRADHVHPVL